MQRRWLLVAIAIAACGDDHHVDSGYGRSAAQPDELTCDDLCSRLSDCVVALCNEDTASSRYDALYEVLMDQCVADCNDQRLSTITVQQRGCIYAATCRQVLDYDDCNTNGSYTCN